MTCAAATTDSNKTSANKSYGRDVSGEDRIASRTRLISPRQRTKGLFQVLAPK